MQRLAREAEERLKIAESKKAAEEEKKHAPEAVQNERHIRLKEALKKAIKYERVSEIESSVAAIKKENMPDCAELISKVTVH